MKKEKYKGPQKGAVKKLREIYNEQRKKIKPSEQLLEILREKPSDKNPPKVANPSKKIEDAEA